MERPKVDESKCFVCQNNEPTHLAVRSGEEFKLCSTCAGLVEVQNNAMNRVRKALKAGDTRGIWQQTLGANLQPTTIKIKEIK